MKMSPLKSIGNTPCLAVHNIDNAFLFQQYGEAVTADGWTVEGSYSKVDVESAPPPLPTVHNLHV